MTPFLLCCMLSIEHIAVVEKRTFGLGRKTSDGHVTISIIKERTLSMAKPFELSGPRSYRRRAVWILLQASISTLLRRIAKGPIRPGWNLSLETSTAYLRMVERAAFRLPTIQEQRLFTDVLLFASPALALVTVTPAEVEGVKGHWYVPRALADTTTMLYLHGGGYAFYSGAYANMIATIAHATSTRTFALEYPLTPEHPYPAQLDSALDAYRWLLASGHVPSQLVVAGDSAGGNLVLTLLLALRERSLPMPALAVALSPWVDIACSGASMYTNDGIDWVGRAMAFRWGEWFAAGHDLHDPMISPLYADVQGLGPLYVQAGSGEILIDQIRDFVDRATRQGIKIAYDEWANMPHDFQAYGDTVPQAADALARLARQMRNYTMPAARTDAPTGGPQAR
jgi:acetyl esterase/lipase